MVESHQADPKLASNWLMGNVNEYVNKNNVAIEETGITPENLTGLIEIIEDGTISSKQAKKVFTELISKGGTARQIAKDLGMEQISDPETLTQMVTEVLDANEQSVEDFKNGKDRAIGFLVGQIMKKSKGQANPKMVNEILLTEIKKR